MADYDPTPRDVLARGTVARLFRWPVKSFAGEELAAARVGPRGVAGDRTHALVDRRAPWRPLSARQAPRALRWAAAQPGLPDDRLPPDDPPPPEVTGPDGTRYAWDDERLADALANALGRPIALKRSLRGHQDTSGTVLLTTEATRVAVEEAVERPLDLRRFRTNLHVELDAPAYAEEGWLDHRVTLGGEVVIRVSEICDRCAIPTRDPERPDERLPELLRWLNREREGFFGVRATVERTGTVRRGDPVVVSVA